MGLSFSLLLSAWNEIIWRKFFGPTVADTIDKVTLRSLSFERKNLRTNSFDKQGSRTNNMEEKKAVEEPDSTKSFDLRKESLDSNTTNKLKVHEKIHITKPTISLPEPFVFFSPRPMNELDAAATTVQKIYKSYRTRRNLADCAVVVEELWWKTLDSAALKRCSVSFFDLVKDETPVSKWARAKTRAAKVGKGLSKDEKAQKLALQHWLEAIDPRHRYGHNLHFYYDKWYESKSTQPFFYWLDIGDGKELNLKNCPRNKLQGDCIKYLGPNERADYEVIVESGKLVYRQTGIPIETTEGSKLIFVLSTSRALYVGQKKKGVFQHSSFLSGGATTAAGRLVAHGGVLEAIWPYSGHYLPTEDNFNEFISFLQDHNVDLTNVKRCSMDDDISSYKIGDEESKEKEAIAANTATSNTEAADITENISNSTNDHQENAANDEQHNTESVAANAELAVFDMNKRLSRKWASGVGARIGCVRDYPAKLQCQALEQVNLSPRTNASRIQSCLPIPSPRPSPKIRLSPRLAYMGIPSPRVSVC